MMVVSVDWSLLGLGALVGGLIGGVFFAGLALGVRTAMRSDRALTILTVSATVRILACVGAAWLVLVQLGPWGFAGFGAAFVLSRRVATSFARGRVPAEGAS